MSASGFLDTLAKKTPSSMWYFTRDIDPKIILQNWHAIYRNSLLPSIGDASIARLGNNTTLLNKNYTVRKKVRNSKITNFT